MRVPEGVWLGDAGRCCVQILQSYLGHVITGAVAHVTDEYAILHFQVELDDGKMERVPGLLHSEQADVTDLWVRLLLCVTMIA